MSTTLNLYFRHHDGSASRLPVTQPKPGLDAAQIRTQAGAIVDSGIFLVKGSDFAAYTGAQLVQTTKTDFA
ncbi:MAG: DUF2922 domain-containing protein [Negativicutes bacterium]|jgi:hypothetical protein